ncbi:MAG: cell surface protein [Rhodobacterales bacterium]|nr:MAG: cell surface protein [Rhodobacterales bacterium]
MQKKLALLLAATAMTPVAALADTLTRVATVPLGGEITGIFQNGDDLFFNVQHPDSDIGTDFALATVGIVANANLGAEELAPAMTDEEKRVVRTSLGDYQILLQEGVNGAGVIKSADGSKELLISNDPDFNGFVPTEDGKGLLFTNWENRPGAMSKAALTRAEDGTYSVDSIDMVDFSGVKGTWVNCFGTVSPWGTPLTSEELYFDNSADWNNPEYKYIDDNKVLAEYLGEYPNPYNYGYIVEITDPTGTATPVKQMAIGRMSHENSVVMPDQTTVYTTSDGTGQAFFKFVADTAGDLTSGTLYAAKVTQMGDAGADAATTAFGLEWVELGHASNDEIAAWVADYDGITLDDYKAGENNYITDEEIADWAAGNAADNRVAFLESNKAAAAKGASAEFRKMEGVNINVAGLEAGTAPHMYVAMSAVEKTMSDGEGDIDVAENKCGVVYEFEMDGYNATKMTPVIAGHGYNGDAEVNQCPLDSISNPDNLVVLEDGRVIVGEDTGKHENNALYIWTKG